jgi:hypothetical protein
LAVSTDHLSGASSGAVSASDDAVTQFVALCPSAALILDSSRTIVQINDIGAGMFGATSTHALVGRDFGDFMSSASRAELRRIYDELSAARTATLSVGLDVEKFGGETVSVFVAARCIDWRSGPAILCVVSDIRV